MLPLICFSLMMLTGFQNKNIQNDVFRSIKNNDSKAIVNHFSTTVNLSLKGEERLSTKFQSELMLTDFFKTNKVNAIKVISKPGDKHSNSYVVYEIATAKEKFHVVVKFMEIKGKTSIIEFKIY